MRQRLLKAILCVALMVSVFFCSSSFAFADEYTGQFDLSPQNYTYLVEFVTPLTPEFGPESFSSYAIGTVYFGTRYSISLDGGYVYNGQLHRRIALTSSPNNSFTYSNMSLSEMYLPSPMTGVNLSVKLSTPSSGSYLDVYINFNDVYINHDVTIQSSFTLKFTQRVAFSNSNSTAVTDANYNITPTVATDTAGYLDQSLPSGVNVGGVINDSAQQQMQQQQQIANQQSQQSAQQHEDLKNGFTDNTYNNNVSNAGSQVDSYIGLEHNLLEQQNQQMSDYADTAFNLNTISPYINAIAMTSTFFTWIWNGFGEMNVVFVIVLAIGVACLILGIRRRG